MTQDFGPCRSCRAPLRHTVVDLGVQPLADYFPTPEEVERGEESFPLHVLVCTRCWLVQLSHFAGEEEILAAHAHSSSSYSETLLAHGRAWADEMVDRFALGADSLVVEVASNDGYLLRNFVDRGIGVLGLEHIAASVEAALALGVPTERERFGPATAARLAAEGRRADLLIGNHNLANTNDLDELSAAMRDVLAPGGTIAVEFHHVLAMVSSSQFDVASHSHCCYLSLLALGTAFQRNGLALVDAEQVDIHGGSVRAYARRTAELPEVAPGVQAVLDVERAAGLDTVGAYEGFAKQVDDVRRGLVDFLREARAEGRSVAAYGAPAKGNTLLNSCGVSTDLLPYTVDRSPAKHGRVMPGAHVPIFPPEHILATRPDYVLVLPWSLAAEITRQMDEVRSWGGRFVVAIPHLRVLD